MKILLFDDHRIFGESLSKLLEDWDAISICHYVSNETEFWNILSVDEWDIVLLDAPVPLCKDRRWLQCAFIKPKTTRP